MKQKNYKKKNKKKLTELNWKKKIKNKMKLNKKKK